MRTVYKYPLRVDTFDGTHMVPNNYRIVAVDREPGKDDGVAVWAEVETTAPMVQVYFLIIGTGHPVPEDMSHIGSVRMPPYMWHVYAHKRGASTQGEDE